MRILVADDDRSLRRVLQFKLESKGYFVVAAEDGQQALQFLNDSQFDLLLSDIKMPKVDGLELLEQARRLQQDLKVILITAHATVAQAVQAVKLGAFDYITKPFEDDELFVALDKAFAFRRLENENKQLKGKLEQAQHGPEMIGVSKPFRAMMAMIDQVASSEATILLTGGSGTGKELVARTLHQKSSRSEGAFVAVNCAAIPRELLESELFGHLKGAFTGAIKNKKGKFAVADGGTFFLDEVGDLALDLQAKLLRALQERVVEPVGSETAVEIDVRIIAATNVNLQERVAAGMFREDLYYRLNVIPIRVPSLAERREDVAALAKLFLERVAPGEDIKLSPPLLESLQKHSWPGNVRELENLIERMVVLRKSKTLTPKDLPEDFGAFESTRNNVKTDGTGEQVTFSGAEEQLVRRALVKSGWNRTRAARLLNMPRHVLIYRMKKYGISEP